jgi:GT2 family glycosyltransferase
MIHTTLDVSVIICAYTEERWDDLVAAVESIQQQSKPPREIIVVIDHNLRLLKRVRTSIPGIIAIENGMPQGLSGARNSGLAIAQGALIAFLDDDATAEPDWLIQLCRCCEDPDVLGTGGTVEPLWLSKAPAWFPKEFSWVVGCTYQHIPETPQVVRNPYGGCACYRREMFEAVGGFRDGIGRIPTLPMGCEETELCIRAQQHWPQKFFLYNPHARIHHRISASRANWRYFRSRCYAEGLSKAIVTQYVGAKDGLASERAYTLRTLPEGVLRNLKSGILHRDLARLQQAGAIIAGLMITTMGYLAGSFSRRLALHSRESISSQKEM